MSVLALGIPLTAVTLLGLLLNLYIILVVVLSKQVHTANNLLLLHLGVVDVCVGTVLGALLLCGGGAGPDLPLELPRAAPGRACTLPGFLLSLLHPLALWTLCGLHTDRYYAISTPLHYGAKVSTRKVMWGLAVAWVGSLLLALLALLPACGGDGAQGAARGVAPAAPTTPADAPSAAQLSVSWPAAPWAPWSPWGPVMHAGIYTATTLLLPATIVLVCNLKVLMIARHHRHRIASAIFEVTLSAQVTITHQRNPFAQLEQGLQGPPAAAAGLGQGISPGAAAAVAAAAAAKFRSRSALCPVLQLLGSLVLLYFPYYGLVLWDALAASKAVPEPYHHYATLAVCLITCSPPVNGLLYGVKNKMLRKTIQNYWRKQMSKSEVNQEIQARTPSTCGSRRPSLTPAGASGVGGGGAGASGGGSTLQRRLSEIVLEPLRSSVSVGSASPRGSKFQRIASDLVWRPRHWLLGRSLNSIEQHALDLHRSRSMKDGWHHSSNTLQIPSVTSNGDLTAAGGNGSHPWPGVAAPAAAARGGSVASLGGSGSGSGSAPSAGIGGSLFVQRVLGHCHPHHLGKTAKNHCSGGGPGGPRHSPSLLLASVSRRSPRILITRAFSEESDSAPPPVPATPIQHSTSASALVTEAHGGHHRQWRRIRYRDQDEDAADPLNGPLSDDSSTPSEHLNGHFPSTLSPCSDAEGDGDPDGDADGEEQALLFSPLGTGTCSPVSSPEPMHTDL